MMFELTTNRKTDKNEHEWTRMNKIKQEKIRIPVYNVRNKFLPSPRILFSAALLFWLLVRFCNKNYQERTKMDNFRQEWTKMNKIAKI